MIEAKNQNHSTLLTFGGAFSNHIAATAAAGKENGFNTIGIIRGEEHLPLNSTLQFAQEQGMNFHYMDRQTYREKSSEKVTTKLKDMFGDFYLLPEGGTNDFAIKGTEEILDLIEVDYDYVCCPVGTGGTIAGIINSCPTNKKVVGFPALKGDFLENEIKDLTENHRIYCGVPQQEKEGYRNKSDNWRLITEYHFGGYAKHKPELIEFINTFKQKYNVQLDPIYTGKMMYGICDMIDKNLFEKGSTIVVVHTGGLQGIKGFNERFGGLVKSD